MPHTASRLILALALVCAAAGAQGGNYVKYGGARAAGLGGAAVADSAAGHLANQALLAGIARPLFELGATIPHTTRELGTYSALAATPLLGGVAALRYQRFGYDLYNENSAGLAYARSLGGGVSLGVEISYTRASMPRPYAAANMVVAELGAAYRLNRRLTLAAHVYNPTMARPTGDPMERPETVVRAGISYRPVDKVALDAELCQSLGGPLSFRAGMEVELAPQLGVRAGYDHSRRTLAAGLGLALGTLRIDMAAGYHNALGVTPHLTVSKSLR